MPETAQSAKKKRRYGVGYFWKSHCVSPSPTLLFEPLELHDVRFLEFHKKSCVSNNFLIYNTDSNYWDVQERPTSQASLSTTGVEPQRSASKNGSQSPEIPPAPKLQVQLTVRHGMSHEDA